MKIIVDTNIIFSSLLSKHTAFSDALFKKEYDFIMPKYAYIELFKYKEKIVLHSRLEEDEILEVLYKLLKNIRVFDENMITPGALKQAYELVKNIDEKDIIFIGLAIELNGLLWTGDKKLAEGLLKKGFNRLCRLEDRSIVRINPQ